LQTFKTKSRGSLVELRLFYRLSSNNQSKFDMSKYVELAKKLYELSKKGQAGESDNAFKKLNTLMKAHGITMEQLEDSGKEINDFKVPVKFQWLFIQVASTVGEGMLEVYGAKTFRNRFFIECTYAEKVEIEAKFDFYKKAFESDLKAFRLAFIESNRLFPPKKSNQEPEDKTERYSKEELAKIAAIASGLNKHDFHKQIGDK